MIGIARSARGSLRRRRLDASGKSRGDRRPPAAMKACVPSKLPRGADTRGARAADAHGARARDAQGARAADVHGARARQGESFGSHAAGDALPDRARAADAHGARALALAALARHRWHRERRDRRQRSRARWHLRATSKRLVRRGTTPGASAHLRARSVKHNFARASTCVLFVCFLSHSWAGFAFLFEVKTSQHATARSRTIAFE